MRKASPAPDDEPIKFAGVIMLLNRCLRAAAAILDTDVAMIVLTDPQGSRIVAAHGSAHKFLVQSSMLAIGPYGPGETYVVPDATGRQDLQAMLGSAALESIGFFYRRPLAVHAGFVIGLLVFGRRPRAALARNETRILDELADRMTEECERLFPSDASVLSPTLRMSAPDLESWHARTLAPVAIFDEALRLLAINGPLREFFAFPLDNMIGKPLSELDVPAQDNLAFLFRSAIQSGISTPRIEVSIQGEAGEPTRILAVVGSPITPLDGAAPRLLVTFEDVTAPAGDRNAREASQPREESNPADATVEFLMETLVRRRALRSRKGLSYVTLRAWRQPIRQHQIRALRALKKSATSAIADTIAAELEADILAMIGASAFRAVVPVPCGHSPADRCLSLEVARALGARIDLPVIAALGSAPQRGSSHPATNATRPPLHRVREVEGPILLIDDVATSGQHLEEACRLLRPGAGALLALAWIGGDANDDPELDAE